MRENVSAPITSARLKAPAAQEIIGGGECKDKAGAHGLQIEGGAMVDTEPILDSDGGCRKGVVRRRGRQHDQVDRLRIDPGMGERGARGIDRQMRSELALGGDMALTDARALHDPFIGGIDPGRQFGIGQHPLRKIRAAAEHDRTY